MNAKWTTKCILSLHLILGVPLANASDAASNPSRLEAGNDLLQFFDGGSLHGGLVYVDPMRGVGWRHPEAPEVIDFQPANLAWIRFENPNPIATQFKPTCWLRFRNGDEVFGKLGSLDSDDFGLETWFSGNLKTPRASVRAIAFVAKGYSVLYEGPTGLEGWKLGREPKGWQYRDGALVASGAGIVGRDFNLTTSSSVEFDLAWSGQFSLVLTLYTDALDRFDYSTSSYMFYLNPGYISLQRVQAGAGATNLDQVRIPGMLNKNKVHLEIRSNLEDATLAVWIDGTLLHRWKDSAGFVAKGSGLSLFTQLDGPTIKLSNIKVSAWDGKFDVDDTAEASPSEDVVYLVNRDKLTGSLKDIRQGKLTFATPQLRVDIPLERVTQIIMSQSTNSPPARNPWEIRAFISGGGIVAFRLEKWDEHEVLGRSVNFGRTVFSARTFRQIQFNLDHSPTGINEFEMESDQLEKFDLEE